MCGGLILCSDSEEMVLTTNDNHSSSDRRRSHHDFSHRVSRKQFNKPRFKVRQNFAGNAGSSAKLIEFGCFDEDVGELGRSRDRSARRSRRRSVSRPLCDRESHQSR